jgi:hypothetical protein
VAGACEHGKAHQGIMKGGILLDQLSSLLASQEGIILMELVT